MNCPHCQAPNADDARFCGSCGQATSSTEPASSPSHGEDPVLIGRVIAGRYRIQAKLGEGGMGAVFKAEQISLKRTVAVKLLRPEMASSQLLLRRFNAEAEAVAKLSHPNTVNIYDFGQDTDGALFIAMEYIEGQSLRHVIHREAPLSLRRALSIALQVSSSLTDAHSRSIIHRDLKPDNVMLQQRGREKDVVRVLDFGIAKLRDENRQSQMAMTQAGDMLGTPQYMAPEQIRAEQIDGRTDVYALGCLLYEMITARLPYEAPTIMSLLSKHLIEVAVPPSQRRPDLGLPPAIDQLILSAMAKDPKVRPATMEAFGEQIADLLATLPPEATQSTGQRPAPSGFVQAVPTPAAHSAAALSAPPPTYQTHGPQMPAPSFPAPTLPPPGAPPALPTQHTRGGGSNKALWIILAVLVLAGAGVGIVMAMRSSPAAETTPSDPNLPEDPDLPETPETPEPPETPETPDPPEAPSKGSDDPWAGGSVPPPTPTPPTPTPTPTPRPKPTAGGIPPECEELAEALERLAACTLVPADAQQGLQQAAVQLRSGYAGKLSPEVRAQISASCKMGISSYQQMAEVYGCP